MVNPLLNFYQLNLNYLLNAASEGFINKKHDPSELAFLSAIINAFKHHDIEMNANQRYHTYYIYLINLLTQYINQEKEDILKQICLTLFDPNADRSSEPSILNQFRVLICKWAACILSRNTVSDGFKCDLKDYSDKISIYEPESVQNEVEEFCENKLYQQLCTIINEVIYKPNTSIISYVTNNSKMNFVDNNECELELINQLTIRKRLRDIDIEELIVSKKYRKERSIEFEKENNTSDKSSFTRSCRSSLKEITNNNRIVISPVKSTSLSLLNTVSEDEIENSPSVERVTRKTAEKNLTDSEKTPINAQEKSPRRITRRTPESTKKDTSDEDIDTVKKTKKFEKIASKDNTNTSSSESDNDEIDNKKQKLRIKFTRKSASKSASESEENVSRTQSLKKTNIKKKVPLNRLADKEKYLNSSFSESPDSELDEDKLDFDESFNTKKKNSLKSRKLFKNSDVNDTLSTAKEPVKIKKRMSEKLSESITNQDTSIENVEFDDDELEITKSERKSTTQKECKRRFWGETETTYLILGVKLYGKGEWAKIIDRFKSKFDNRTSVQLKDKYRNLEKTPSEMKRLEKNAKKIYQKMTD